MKPHEEWLFKAEGDLMPARDEVKEAIGAALKILEFVKNKFSS